MPGQEHAAPRMRAAHVAMQDNPELLPAAGIPATGPGGAPDGASPEGGERSATG